MLEALAQWSKLRLWWTLGLGYFAAVEIATLIASRIPPCVVETQIGKNADGTEYEYCPAFHTVALNFIGFLDDHGEAVTAVATLAIAAFTYTLWKSTDGMLKSAAEQISLARDEFQSSHRPQMRLKHAWFTDQTAWQLDGPLEINLDLVNKGNTVAHVRWINYQSLILPTGERLPQRPPYDEPVPAANVRLTRFETIADLQSGITLARPVCDCILDQQQVLDILWGRQCLYLIGTIEYWDGAGLRQTAFCRRLTYQSYPPATRDLGRFEIEKDPDYEYED